MAIKSSHLTALAALRARYIKLKTNAAEPHSYRVLRIYNNASIATESFEVDPFHPYYDQIEDAIDGQLAAIRRELEDAGVEVDE